MTALSGDGTLYLRGSECVAGETLRRGDSVFLLYGIAFRSRNPSNNLVGLWKPWSNEPGPATVKKGDKFWLWHRAKKVCEPSQ